MMTLDDIQHADVTVEATAIARVGDDPYVVAIGELVTLVDLLFDGLGIPSYVGASKRVEDLFFEAADLSGIKVFTRQFWGSSGKSVVAAIGVKDGRPALLAMVPVELAVVGAWMLNHVEATDAAVALARHRSQEMQG